MAAGPFRRKAWRIASLEWLPTVRRRNYRRLLQRVALRPDTRRVPRARDPGGAGGPGGGAAEERRAFHEQHLLALQRREERRRHAGAARARHDDVVGRAVRDPIEGEGRRLHAPYLTISAGCAGAPGRRRVLRRAPGTIMLVLSRSTEPVCRAARR